MTKAQLLVLETRAKYGMKIAKTVAVLAVAAVVAHFAYNAGNENIQASIGQVSGKAFVSGLVDVGQSMKLLKLVDFDPR